MVDGGFWRENLSGYGKIDEDEDEEDEDEEEEEEDEDEYRVPFLKSSGQ